MASQDLDPDLSVVLKSGGLDPDYWLDKFQSIGIKFASALQFVEGDFEAYTQLQQSTQYTWENKALKKLLQIEDKKEAKDNKENKDESTEQVKKYLQQSDQILLSLKALQEEGKNRHDSAVKQLEKQLCKKFHISPESWITEDENFDEVITKLEVHYSNISRALQLKECQTDTVVIMNASNGQALQGILLMNNHKELVKDRRYLLRVPEKIQFRGPSKPSESVVKQFSARSEEDAYRNIVDAFGLGVSASGNSPIIEGISVGGGIYASSKVEEQETYKEHQQQMYLSTIKHSSIQLAACIFQDSDLILSENAVEDLKKINTMITAYGPAPDVNSKVHAACIDFFHKYGSHVSTGPIHFGGIYCWTCSSTGFNKEDGDTLRNLQSDAIGAKGGVAFMGFGVSTKVDISDIKSDYARRCSVKALAQTSLKVSVNGGPQDITSFPVWRSGLVAHNNTWIVTDRGANFVSVWEIIKLNYGKELNRLVKVLRSAWETFTNLEAKHDLLRTSYDSEKILKEVQEWTEAKDLPCAEEYLNYLLNVKNDLLHASWNPMSWADLYLSKPMFQKFLELVLDQCPKNKSLGHYIKFLMRQLVEESDLDSLTEESFPQKEKFSNLLYPPQLPISPNQFDCQNFEDFLLLLRQTKQNMRMKVGCGWPAHLPQNAEDIKTVTIHVALSINSLRSHLQTKYEDIFITTLVYPFIDNVITYASANFPLLLKQLSLDHIEYLHSLLSEELPIFQQKRDTLTQIQAYLFHLSLSIYLNNKSVSESQLHDNLSHVKKVIGGEIQPKILGTMARYQTNNHLIKDCQETLASLMNMKSSPSFTGTGYSISLQEVLSVPDKPAYDPNESHHKHVKVHDVVQEATEVTRLFKLLGLSEYYPKKLTLMEALSIKQLCYNESDSLRDSGQLYYIMLQRLMAYDYQCRLALLENLYEPPQETDSCEQALHPLDSLLAIIHCADDFLRQDLTARLATCQLAVPLILPDPFTQQLILPLWSMRTIIKEWRTSSNDSKSHEPGTTRVQHECPIVSYPTTIVSFIRLGKGMKSKSKLLNGVINDCHFNHFFHRDCRGGSCESLLVDGLVDMAWYLPGGSTDNIFPDVVTFLNLHGDARNHFCQTSYLSQISSMSFIFVSDELTDGKSIEIMKKFSTIPGGVVALFETKTLSDEVRKALPDLNSMNMTAESEAEIQKYIRGCIKKKLNKIKPKTLEDCVGIIHNNKVWEVREIQIDEDNDDFKQGQKLASSLYKLISDHGEENTSMKQGLFPLQGQKLWQEWANKDKEQHRQLNKTSHAYGVHDYTLLIEKQKAEIRFDQLEHIKHLAPFMSSFLTCLLSNDWMGKTYFLHCMTLYLNNHSRRNVAELEFRYQTTCSKVADLKELSKGITTQDKNTLREILECKKILEVIQEQIINASLGFQHLLQELAQIYEAAEGTSEMYKQISRFPKAGAELLIAGYPLEIMDGNVAHVPIKWIRAVMHQLGSLLNDPHVYVLSILGIQSTGKSTLLNTIFGLKFDVGAGRCTHGAFMHLLPVSKDLSNDLLCDYILVVDTEGLRSPILDPEEAKKRDNELATFIIGLANVSLVNIYGEVSGDINDILQTVIHALIRMRKVNLKPSCLFVHQNASDNSKVEIGRVKFIQTLDKVTSDAAVEEKCQNIFKTFSDVIKFDVFKDVHYLQGLWMGDPPMAPYSRGYCESALRLKYQLIELARRNSIRLSTFEYRINDLWNALLHEDFVFSFKNSAEIQAYNKLEATYACWEWEFQRKMMKWENHAENEINSFEIDELESLVEKKVKPNGELQVQVESVYKQLKSEMIIFFKQSKQRDIQAQWQNKFELKLKDLAEELQLHANIVCRELSSGRKAMDEMDQEYKDRSWIVQQVKIMITTMKREQAELKINLEQKVDLCLNKESLTEEEIEEISKDGPLTVAEIRNVLSQGHLTTEDERKILKRKLFTEEQLKEQFNAEWTKLLQKLPRVHTEQINIEEVVETKLLAHVGQTLKGKMTKKLQKKEMKKYGPGIGERLQFTVKDKHVARGRLQKLSDVSRSSEDPSMKHAQVITDIVLDRVCAYLTKTCENCHRKLSDQRFRPSRFKPQYTQELLLEVDKTIEDNCADSVFTEDYKLDLYLTICGYAIRQFETMTDLFRKWNDPRFYLKDEKNTLFLLFKSEYYQLTLEKSIVCTLCEHFEKRISCQVHKNLGRVLIDDMMHEQCCQTKNAFKTKILRDLGDDLSSSDCPDHPDLKKYFLYIQNPIEALKQWLWNYTKLHCEFKETNGQTRLESLAQNEISNLIQQLARKFVSTSKKLQQDIDGRLQIDADMWMKEFLKAGSEKDIIKYLGTVTVDCSDYFGKLLDETRFMEELMEGLENLKLNLHKHFQKVWFSEITSTDAYTFLEDKLVGCREQCPFCNEQCDLGKHDDSYKHRVAQHRPDCFGGYKVSKSGVISFNTCSVLVGSRDMRFKSHKDEMKRFRRYKKYQKSYPTWWIPVDFSAKASVYWKWFVGKHSHQIAEYFGGKTPEVPLEWQELKWNDVKKDVIDRFSVLY